MSGDLRHRHVITAADLRAGHRVLEIGPGHGVTLSLIVDAVGDGRVWAVDRSPKMVAAATRRNQHAIDAGRVNVQCSRVQDAVFDDAAFDRIIAMRVREVWDDADVLPTLASWLRADGLLCIGIDAPQQHTTERVCRELAQELTRHGFRAVSIAQAQDPRVAAVTARPSPPS